MGSSFSMWLKKFKGFLKTFFSIPFVMNNVYIYVKSFALDVVFYVCSGCKGVPR